MREIKFRAWWISEGKYLWRVEDFYDTLGDAEHGNEWEPACSFGNILEYPEEYIVEQFTGLHDKNGREIYEGDLLNWVNWQEELTEVPDVYTVSWLDDQARFTLNCYRNGKLLDPKDDLLDVGEAFAVIGSIHENGYLLK